MPVLNSGFSGGNTIYRKFYCRRFLGLKQIRSEGERARCRRRDEQIYIWPRFLQGSSDLQSHLLGLATLETGTHGGAGGGLHLTVAGPELKTEELGVTNVSF